MFPRASHQAELVQLMSCPLVVLSPVVGCFIDLVVSLLVCKFCISLVNKTLFS